MYHNISKQDLTYPVIISILELGNFMVRGHELDISKSDLKSFTSSQKVFFLVLFLSLLLLPALLVTLGQKQDIRTRAEFSQAPANLIGSDRSMPANAVPPGCTYQRVICARDPCNPILVCQSPKTNISSCSGKPDGTKCTVTDCINCPLDIDAPCPSECVIWTGTCVSQTCRMENNLPRPSATPHTPPIFSPTQAPPSPTPTPDNSAITPTQNLIPTIYVPIPTGLRPKMTDYPQPTYIQPPVNNPPPAIPVSTGVVYGTVRNSLTGKPVTGARISVSLNSIYSQQNLKTRSYTSTAGSFVLELPPGNYRLTASRFGYYQQSMDITISPDTQHTLDFAIEPRNSFITQGPVESGFNLVPSFLRDWFNGLFE